ncbi:MAG: hypothetical protein IPK17_18975 [Chloroflexi bacterium]|uniref:hypothetical protein n=1 Tax=Candidatus Flexifilum breve TaxID=3140694 RepID=UPI003134B3F0|nr:hypothetical protein [Chloroflexota bacterium]
MTLLNFQVVRDLLAAAEQAPIVTNGVATPGTGQAKSTAAGSTVTRLVNDAKTKNILTTLTPEMHSVQWTENGRAFTALLNTKTGEILLKFEPARR